MSFIRQTIDTVRVGGHARVMISYINMIRERSRQVFFAE